MPLRCRQLCLCEIIVPDKKGGRDFYIFLDCLIFGAILSLMFEAFEATLTSYNILLCKLYFVALQLLLGIVSTFYFFVSAQIWCPGACHKLFLGLSRCRLRLMPENSQRNQVADILHFAILEHMRFLERHVCVCETHLCEWRTLYLCVENTYLCMGVASQICISDMQIL